MCQAQLIPEYLPFLPCFPDIRNVNRDRPEFPSVSSHGLKNSPTVRDKSLVGQLAFHSNSISAGGSRGPGMDPTQRHAWDHSMNTDCPSFPSRMSCFSFLFNLVTAVRPATASLWSLSAQLSSPYLSPF